MGEVICITCRQGESYCVCVFTPARIHRLRYLTDLLTSEINEVNKMKKKEKELKDG
jgi:hypothetical protein